MRFFQQQNAGLNCYLVIFDLDAGKVWDYTTSTWKTLATAANPAAAMTGVSQGLKTLYYADIDLTTLYATDTQVHRLVVVMYQRSGGSPAPLTDTAFAQTWDVPICCGHVVPGDPTASAFTVDVTADYTVSNGTSMHLTAELLFNGNTVPLASLDAGATCAFAVTRDATTTGGNRSNVFSIASGTVGAANTSSRFEAERANPGLAANAGYTATATIVTGGVTYVGSAKFVTF